VDYSLVLNAFDAAIILGVSVPTALMASQISKKPLRTLSLLLASFLAVHGLYHLAEALATIDSLSIFGPISDVIVEPASWVLLFAFMAYFARRGG
jgi:hypothetical protein